MKATAKSICRGSGILSHCSVDSKRKTKGEIQRNLHLNPPTEIQEFAGENSVHN